MIPQNSIDFYGDQTRWFMGEVVDNENDPLEIGRVRVRVYGVYDTIPDEDLPWAQIVVPVTQGIHEGKGQNLGILVGTQVFGMFLDGKNSQLPMVIGTVPKEGDTNEKAIENYPHNKVYQTERGHYKEYDDTEGKRRIREQHAKGQYYEMNEDGDIVINAPEENIIIRAAKTITIVASVAVSVSAPTVNINASEFITLNSGG